MFTLEYYSNTGGAEEPAARGSSPEALISTDGGNKTAKYSGPHDKNTRDDMKTHAPIQDFPVCAVNKNEQAFCAILEHISANILSLWPLIFGNP